MDRHADFKNGAAYNKICYSPCSTYIAAGGANGNVYIWNHRAGKLDSVLTGGHKTAITCCTWSAEGNSLATCAFDKSFVIWQ